MRRICTHIFLGCLFFQFAITSHADSSEYLQEPVFDGRVYVQQNGDPNRPGVVLVHGIGDIGAGDWDRQIEWLTQDYYVLSFDLPGFGRSTKANELYSPERYASLVNWLVRKKVKRPFALVGHSLGGAIAAAYAGTFPGTFEKLVLVDVAGVLHQVAVTKHFADAWVFKDKYWQFTPEHVADNVSNFVNQYLEDFSQDFGIALATAPFRKIALGADPKRIAAAALVNSDFSQWLVNIRGETLIIWGRDDAITPLRTARAIHDRIETSQLIVLDGVGHNPMREATDKFNDVLSRGLKNPIKAQRARPDTKRFAKDMRCKNENQKRIEGSYRHIMIENCRDVTIENTFAQTLTVIDSQVDITNSNFVAQDGVAISAMQSRITATASDFENDVGVQSSLSRFDFAAVDIRARDVAVKSFEKSTFVFSVSRVASALRNDTVHGRKIFMAEEQW